MRFHVSSSVGSLGVAVQMAGEQVTELIKDKMQSRAVRVANELRNAELRVIRGQGHGRRYRVPGTRRMYTASAPGEVPAVRTGTFRRSWQPSSIMYGNVAISKLETNYTVNGHNLGGMLENGTGKMAPRPHQEKILEEAKPRVLAIYNAPYGSGQG